MMEKMITVDQALELICSHIRPLDAEMSKLTDARGLVLAEDIYSAYDIPAFPQSGMDGYAFSFQEGLTSYLIEGEVAAGDAQTFLLSAGKASRIFTGAAVPPGADTVLPQEKAQITDGRLAFDSSVIKKGDNVRLPGSEIAKGSLALSAGAVLHPARIGFLSGIGIAEAKVIPSPKVSIIVTGNELQQAGEPLGYGQVYDSNSPMLKACLEQLGIRDTHIYFSGDIPERLNQLLDLALQTSDLVLMTGGVSVGDYDFTLGAFEACGIVSHFHKIRQKPGKPMLFGTRNHQAVYGLPGNPASVLTCFYEYVLPAISIMTGDKKDMKVRQAKLSHAHRKPAGLTHFLKAKAEGDFVTLKGGQESYKLSSYAEANCIAVLPEEATDFAEGQLIDIHIIP
jgi:molybdopterin molybdotransferase